MVFSAHFLIFLASIASIFGNGKCSSASPCPSGTNDNQTGEQLPTPRLVLWTANDSFPILKDPGDKVVDLVATPVSVSPLEADVSDLKIQGMKVTCTAPYPVLLVSLMANDSEEEFKMPARVFPLDDEFFYENGLYTLSERGNPETLDQRRENPSSNTFSVFRTLGFLYVGVERDVSVFACEAVQNPCLRSAGKLVISNLGESLKSGSLTFYNFTVTMTENLQPHRHPFLTSSYNSLPKASRCNRDNCTGDSSANGTRVESESDCDAIFYYQIIETRSSTEYTTKFKLTYSCLFSNGSPGIIKIHRCINRGRCGFAPMRKQTVQNCWRPFLPGTKCENCTKMNIGLHLMEPFVPICSSREKLPSPWLEEDSPDGPYKMFYSNFLKKEDMEDGLRVVKGTPLYVGFPSGFNISRPDIRTRDDEKDGNERMIRMHIFEEVQLVGSLLKITCDSSSYYTARGFLWALKLHNKTQLKFLQVSNETRRLRRAKVERGQIFTQTINYHLQERDLEVERIFCFASVQNSYNWIEASRPLQVVSHVQEFFKPGRSSCEFPANDSRLQLNSHPQLVIKPYFGNEFVIPSENEVEYPFDSKKYFIQCEADYPIELIHDSILPPEGLALGGNFQYSYQFLLPHEQKYAMTYNFSVLGFDLLAENYSQFFRCQSIENPCLHRSFQFVRVRSPGSVQSPQRENQYLRVRSFPPGKPSQPETVKTELGRPPKYEECQVLFFYKETPDKKGYEFRCEFPMEQPGTVNFHYCTSMNVCKNTLRNRRQPPECWRNVVSWENCQFKCDIKRADGFRPFVATCSFDRSKYEIEWRAEDGPRYPESTLGNFAVFGLSTRPEELVPIYFSEKDIDPSKMTYLEPFDPYQFTGTNLNVTCTVSAFFNGPDVVHSQIAKYFAPRDDFEPVAARRRSVLNKPGNYWSFTQTVELGNDTDLSQIQCIGLYWKGSKSSRDIHIHAPEPPEIALLVKDSLGERRVVERGGKVAAEEEPHVFFPLSSTNVSLICHGFGYPPPEISFLTNAANEPKIESTVVNVTLSLSRITFPVVDVGVQGTYICNAKNSQGKVTASIKVGIKYPVSKSVVVISSVGSFVLLLLILALFLFVRRVRKLKQRLRNLTDEEEKRFRFGDKTVDPTDNNAGILAAAYDPNLEVSPDLIEIDDESILGAGEFGIVRPGFLNLKDSKVPVAVKMPKFNVTTENFISFLNEIKIMSFVQNHENVLQILGASTLSIKIRRALVALEFCELGNLKNFLRGKKHAFTNEFLNSCFKDCEQMEFCEETGTYPADPRTLLPESERLETLDLLNFSFGIANGMNFLAEKKVIHGDLAARNVLLTQNREVKISDFGFSAQLKSYENYKETNPLSIPWRWFPIEALVNQKFSLKSDCWSYGILLYEIFSLGEIPYPEFDRFDLNFIQRLRDGYRMEKPEFANEDIYDLMTECWRKDPNERPTFLEICEKILNLSSEMVVPKFNLV